MKGQDKGLLNLLGQPMIEYVLRGLASKLDKVLISANRNVDTYSQYGVPVISDLIPGHAGPLAGIAAAMGAADTDYVLTIPCDGPILPQGLIGGLIAALNSEEAEICTAHTGERLQPVYALLNCRLLPNLNSYLESGERKIDLWYRQHRLAIADFSEQPDAFINVNSPEELVMVEAQLAALRESRGNVK